MRRARPDRKTREAFDQRSGFDVSVNAQRALSPEHRARVTLPTRRHLFVITESKKRSYQLAIFDAPRIVGSLIQRECQIESLIHRTSSRLDSVPPPGPLQFLEFLSRSRQSSPQHSMRPPR